MTMRYRMFGIDFAMPLAFALVAVSVSADDRKPDPKSIEFFEKQVRPLLVARCASCHGPAQQFSSLRLDSREALLRGGTRGPAIVPGDAKASLLARAIRHDGLKMPVGGKLDGGEIAAIEKWINLGAPWPNDSATSGAPGLYERLKKEHWAFQRVRSPQPDATVDRFIVAALRQAGLQPSEPAGRRTLIRRLSFVL